MFLAIEVYQIRALFQKNHFTKFATFFTHMYINFKLLFSKTETGNRRQTSESFHAVM